MSAQDYSEYIKLLKANGFAVFPAKNKNTPELKEKRQKQKQELKLLKQLMKQRYGSKAKQVDSMQMPPPAKKRGGRKKTAPATTDARPMAPSLSDLLSMPINPPTLKRQNAMMQ